MSDRFKEANEVQFVGAYFVLTDKKVLDVKLSEDETRFVPIPIKRN